jgi:undecaprenyl-diphosphatase
MIFQSLVIGILQGLTEFLPISSSAHLIVVPRMLGWDDPFLNSASFDVMLHAGTLVALLLYFWADLWRLLGAWLASLRDRRIGDDPDRRLAWLVLITTIPGALLGAGLESFFDTYFRDHLALVGVFLATGAAILWLAERSGRRDRDLSRMRVGDAVLIGAAQALALFPGISRSGITIAAGLFAGLEREAAARFSFLMGTPIIAGAALWKARELLSGGIASSDVAPLLVGMLGAVVAGLLAIRFLLAYLRGHSTTPFIVYRVVAAAAVFVFVLSR